MSFLKVTQSKEIQLEIDFLSILIKYNYSH